MGNDASTSLNSLEKLQGTNCRIVVVGPKSGDDCLLELVNLPPEARILATGSTLEELQSEGNLFTEVSTQTFHPLIIRPCLLESPLFIGKCAFEYIGKCQNSGPDCK